MQSQLASKQNEIDNLSEKYKQLQRETHLSKRDAKSNADAVIALQESMRQTKFRNEQLESSLKDTRNQLDDNQISNHSLKTKNDCLQSEIKSMVEQHKEHISTWTKGQDAVVSAMKQQYAAEAQTQEKLVDNLRRANSVLENERSRCQRDQQSLEIRCSALEKTLVIRDKEQNERFKELLHRSAKSDEQLDTSRSLEKELKRKVAIMEGKLATLHDTAKGMEAQHVKAVDGLQKELVSLKQENESLSSQLEYVKGEMENASQEFSKNKQTMQLAMEHKVKVSEIECEALRMSKASEQLKTKDSEGLHEKQILMYTTLLEQTKAEKKESRIELERTISDEREISQVSTMIGNQHRYMRCIPTVV